MTDEQGTVQLRNTNPLGAVDLPLIGRQGDPSGEVGRGCLEPGEVFEVDADLAGRAPSHDEDGGYDEGEGLLAQVGNYELVPATGPQSKSLSEMTIDELKACAAAHDIDVTGLTLKADLLEAVTASNTDSQED